MRELNHWEVGKFYQLVMHSLGGMTKVLYSEWEYDKPSAYDIGNIGNMVPFVLLEYLTREEDLWISVKILTPDGAVGWMEVLEEQVERVNT